MKLEELQSIVTEITNLYNKSIPYHEYETAVIAILQKHVVGRAELYQTIEADLAFQEELGRQANMPDLLEKVRVDNRNFVEMAFAQLRECAKMYQNPTHFLSAWLRATIVMVKVYEDLLKYKHVNETKTSPNIIVLDPQSRNSGNIITP